MKYYNALYIVAISALVISFSTFGMEHSKLPEHMAKQLILTQGIHNKEIEFLEKIIEQQKDITNRSEPFNLPKPYFKDMMQSINTIKEEVYRTSAIKQVNTNAMTLINQTAANQTLINIEDKLAYIKEYLSDDTLWYLEQTWQHNLPELVTLIEYKKDETQEPGTVEDVLSEEESEETQKQELKQLTYTNQQQTKTSTSQAQKQSSKEQSSTKKPEPQPGFLKRIVTFVWNTITNTVNYILSFFR